MEFACIDLGIFFYFLILKFICILISPSVKDLMCVYDERQTEKCRVIRAKYIRAEVFQSSNLYLAVPNMCWEHW